MSDLLLPDSPASAAVGVPPVERAIRLLRAIADGDPVTNMSRTARALAINRTTLMRLLQTLEAERFIERRPQGDGYRIGLGLVGIAAGASYSQDLVQTAMPVVTHLAESVGLSAHVGVLDGTDALYLVRQVPNVPLASNIHVGSRVPAYATTLGRIIVAFWPDEKIDRVFGGLAFTSYSKHSPRTLDAFKAMLAADRAAGLAWSESHYVSGVSSFAGPIFDRTGEPVAAVNVTGPAQVFSAEPGRRSRIGEAVRAAADEISKRLGHVAKPAAPAAPTTRRRTA
ncbi:hypothetical protein CCR97_19755 [Rhodoplanes elegans]|uniref:IclR family transcriptional regulator n=1 Tax=Rhodoplanes elegans TaxID=29408 RepID=A0A327KJZ7_9BRAD|nr:IclR family transcriptional regulator [Rhodoplanes elegans]MBK5960413.1 hypothetical protein [Rhodoplanes elegans]RAI38807.1 hypothetical protein CH338_11475 [Rhodoplanes elegans]